MFDQKKTFKMLYKFFRFIDVCQTADIQLFVSGRGRESFLFYVNSTVWFENLFSEVSLKFTFYVLLNFLV